MTSTLQGILALIPPATMLTELWDLPDELFLQILLHLDLIHDLARCQLVSSLLLTRGSTNSQLRSVADGVKWLLTPCTYNTSYSQLFSVGLRHLMGLLSVLASVSTHCSDSIGHISAQLLRSLMRFQPLILSQSDG